MADITASMVKELRERTQAGMSDCKNALVEAGGDMVKAVEVILKKGIVKAAARAGRVATEGEVRTHVTADGKRGTIVEINCQTDFVSRGDEFKNFVGKVEAEKQKDILAAQFAEEQQALPAEKRKPEAMAAKIVEGKLSKWFTEVTLLGQESVTDPGKSVDAIRTDLAKHLGGDVHIH